MREAILSIAALRGLAAIDRLSSLVVLNPRVSHRDWDQLAEVGPYGRGGARVLGSSRYADKSSDHPRRDRVCRIGERLREALPAVEQA